MCARAADLRELFEIDGVGDVEDEAGVERAGSDWRTARHHDRKPLTGRAVLPGRADGAPQAEGRRCRTRNGQRMNDLKTGIAIGIDGGGTKTLGILVNVEGREVTRAQAGGANPWDVGPDAARIALQ